MHKSKTWRARIARAHGADFFSLFLIPDPCRAPAGAFTSRSALLTWIRDQLEPLHFI